MPSPTSNNIDRLPKRFQLFTIGAATLLFAAVLFRDFWTTTIFIAGNDIISPEYLRWAWGWEQVITHGRLPLWNSGLFGGFPFVSTFGFCPFYPLAWPFVALPASLAITCRFVLSLAAGGMGFYAFARAIQIPFARAFFIALLYQSGSHAITLAFPGHIHKLEAIAWTPWAMAGAVMMVREGRWRWAVGTGVAWALQLLASHTQIFFATAWMVGGYVLLGAGVRAFREKSYRAAMQPLLCLVLAVVICVGLSAIQMLPGMEMARISNRAGGLSWEEASRDALPFEELAELVLPSFRGDSTQGLTVPDPESGKKITLPYVGQWHGVPGTGQRLVSDYTGIWIALFALLGLYLTRGGKRWFFLAGTVVAGILSTGTATPLYKIAYLVIPFFSSFRSPGSLQIATHFFLFALAALGLHGVAQRLDAASPIARRKAMAFQFLAVVVAMLLYVALRYFEMSSPLYGPTDEATFSNYTKILGLRSLSHVVLFFGLGCLTLPLIFSRRAIELPHPSRKNFCGPAPEEEHPQVVYRHSWRTRIGMVLLLAVALIDTSSHTSRFLPKGSTAQLEVHLRHHWIDDAILKDAQGIPYPTMADRGNELSNRPMMRNVRTLFGYHPVVFANYEKILRIKGFDSPLVGELFAQNYLTIPASDDVPDGWCVLKAEKGLQLLARKKAIPFAQIPRKITKTGKMWDEMGIDEWRRMLGDAAFDPGVETFCEGEYEWSADNTFPLIASDASLPEVEVVRSNSDEFRLGISDTSFENLPESTGKLVPCLVAMPAGPGWRVRIEKRTGADMDAPLFGRLLPEDRGWLKAWPRQANGFFLLVPLLLEPGAQTIVSYRPASFRIGAWITLGTILLIGACWATSLFLHSARRRRSRVMGNAVNNPKKWGGEPYAAPKD